VTFHGTTILGVRKDGRVALGGDGALEPFGHPLFGDAHADIERLIANIERVVVGKRDVVRLVNAVTATYSAVRGEVNPADFTALEPYD